MLRTTSALALAATLVGCASAPAVRPQAPAPAFTEAIHWTRNSAEHRASYLQTYALASRAVALASADLVPRRWAVILDADETVIDNSLYQTEQGGGRYDIASWNEYVRRRASPPLPGAVAFLEGVRARGGVIAIVTNRLPEVCPDTEANFRGFAIPYDVMLCGSGDKNPRFEKVAKGEALTELGPLHVLAFVGDNIRDFPGLDQPINRGDDAAFAEFGRRFFMLPNPMYGSWERNPRE